MLTTHAPGEQWQRYKVLAAGILSLILVLGISRFAYTPLLPLMQDQAGLGVRAGGWLAAWNYAGYLTGALIASQISDLVLKDRLYRIGLIVAVISTAAMAMTTDVFWWSLARFIAGLSSAAGMLLGTGLILNWLIRHQHRHELGIHFAGVGLGIAACAAAVALMTPYLDWDAQWWLLSAAGIVLLIPAWRWLPPPDTTPFNRSGEALVNRPPSAAFMRLFMLAYACAGVGYVISATFIVAIIDALPGMQGRGALAFFVIGIAAAPACILWDLVARRIGELNALIAASLIQAVGILLPVVSPGLFGALAGAVLFGATFIGLVSLVLTMAGRYYPTRPAKMMGKMTISYGVAQILGPALIGWLAGWRGGYADGLYLASAAMLVGAGLLVLLRRLDRVGK